jgi:tetratricopeptide (TPR) repeat protein
MSLRGGLRPWVVAGALAGVAWPGAGRAFSNVAIGDRLDNPSLPTLAGPRAELLSAQATASVFLFFRPQQEHSLDALRDLEAIRRELAGRPVRFVAVVSDSWSAQEVRETLREAAVEWPVLIDVGDELYGKLGVRLHPVVGIADRARRLAAYEHYRRINFREIVMGRLRIMLGDLREADMARVLEPEKATTGTLDGEARRHLNLARALWKRGNAEKALESVRKSLAAAPLAAAYALEGEILAATGRCAEARPLFEAALRMNSTEASALKGRRACQP